MVCERIHTLQNCKNRLASSDGKCGCKADSIHQSAHLAHKSLREGSCQPPNIVPFVSSASFGNPFAHYRQHFVHIHKHSNLSLSKRNQVNVCNNAIDLKKERLSLLLSLPLFSRSIPHFHGNDGKNESSLRLLLLAAGISRSKQDHSKSQCFKQTYCARQRSAKCLVGAMEFSS